MVNKIGAQTVLLFWLFLSEPSEFSSGQCPGNLCCWKEKQERELDETPPPAGKKATPYCSHPQHFTWWPDPENPLETFRRILNIFFPYTRKKKEDKLFSYSMEKSKPCSSWTKPEPLWPRTWKLKTSASLPGTLWFTCSSPKPPHHPGCSGCWWKDAIPCRHHFSDTVFLPHQKTSLKVFAWFSSIAQFEGVLLWATLMHIWKLTAHLPASDGQTQRVSPALGLYFVGSVATGENFPPPQAQSCFTKLQHATS